MNPRAVPDDGEMLIAGLPVPGRQLRVGGGTPVTWVSEKVISYQDWSEMARGSAKSGLQPFLLPARDGGRLPRYATEKLSEPQDIEDVGRMDAARMLERWWRAKVPTAGELARDPELRGTFAPFGERFPGVAPAVARELEPELMRRAVRQYARPARAGLVPAARPADILPRLGWAGAANHRRASELAVVLRSWEDRFGARLIEVGFDDIRLLVSRPPQDLEAALPVAAEHLAFSDDAHKGCQGIADIARAVVNNPFWDFWWD